MKQKEVLKFAFAVTLYGTIGMFLRYVSVPVAFVAFTRGIIGTLFILGYLVFKKQKVNRESIKKNFIWLCLSGIFLGLNWLFLFEAYMNTTVAIASLCNYMAPLIVIIVAPVILKEKLQKEKLPYVLMALVGIILVLNIRSDEQVQLLGIIYGFLAAFCFVGIVLCNRKMQEISPYDKAIMQLSISALTLLPYVIIHDFANPVTFDYQSIMIISLLGIVHTGVAYIFWFSGLGSLPVHSVAIIGYWEPAVSVLCSAFFLKEELSIFGWLGAIMILLAAILSEKKQVN